MPHALLLSGSLGQGHDVMAAACADSLHDRGWTTSTVDAMALLGRRSGAVGEAVFRRLLALADVAAADGLLVETKSGLKRQAGAPMPPRVVTEVFRAAKDAVGSADGQSAADRVIFRVTDIKVPTFDANSTAVKRSLDQLKDGYSDDLLSQYVARLEHDIGTDVNQNALAQAVGRTADQSGF